VPCPLTSVPSNFFLALGRVEREEDREGKKRQRRKRERKKEKREREGKQRVIYI
jgi:hypothetical protein